MKHHPAIVISTALLAMLSACTANRETPDSNLAAELARLNAATEELKSTDQSVTSQITRFCGDCHALPNPQSFVREVWYDEIEKGFEFYARSGRSDLQPPALQSVLQFYRSHAPEQIVFPEPLAVNTLWRSRFEQEKLDWKDESYVSPAISSIHWIQFMPEGEFRLIVTDMRDGSISLVKPVPEQTTRKIIGRVGNPARVTSCDLNQDGSTDLVVADLGSFSPYDHAFGKVIWLKRDSTTKDFQATTIAQNLGRVADVAVADFSGDSKSDLIVAEFGHRRTGSIRLMTNDTFEGEKLSFREQVLDIRPGTIRVPVHDWNRDGALDFAAVISQEFECVELFVNRGRKFDIHRASTGADLTFGSVGIELADLDQDGDQDILYVNGDCFDNNFANRSHGIQWLENLGDLEFRNHRLAELAGAYRAVAADIDRDDDLDILAVANLPTTVYPVSLGDQHPASIILLAQETPLQFKMHVLERGTPRYPALEVADFNGDGKMDFVVGSQLFDTDPVGSPAQKLPRLTIWWQK